MASNDSQKSLKTFSTSLNDLVGEAISEDLAGKRGDIDACRFILKDVLESLKV
jgi:hypothetical protein